MDVITNEVLKRALRFTGKVGVVASEEEDRPVSYIVNVFHAFDFNILIHFTQYGMFIVIFFHKCNQKMDVVSQKKQQQKEVVDVEGSMYVTVFDPLDGSSNIDAGIPTGW